MMIRPQGMSDRDWAAALVKQVEKYQQLVKTEGWQEFDKYMEGEQKMMEASMSTVATSDLAMKLLGSYNTLKRMRAFPHLTLEACVRELQNDKK